MDIPFEKQEINGTGIYAFFPFDALDENGKGVFKIGIAGNFDKRIKNYHTYLPAGLYYKCFLNRPSLKRKGLDFATYYHVIEKEILEDIRSQGGVVIKMSIRVRNGGETEWIYASEKQILNAFDRAYKKYGGVNTDLIYYNLNNVLKKRMEFLKKHKIYKGEIYFT